MKLTTFFAGTALLAVATVQVWRLPGAAGDAVARRSSHRQPQQHPGKRPQNSESRRALPE